MKRKEDADERRKQETQQRELAQKGHWKIASTAPTSTPKLPLFHSFYCRFLVEYDATVASSIAGRLSYGKFNPEIEVCNASFTR